MRLGRYYRVNAFILKGEGKMLAADSLDWI
jgi:hypothetical protein